MRKLVIALLVLLAVAGVFTASLFLVPWNNVLEGRLIAVLNSKGLNDVTLEVDKVTFNHAVLKNIRIGKEDPLILNEITLNYSPRELLSRTLQDVTLTGVNLELRQGDAGWSLVGLGSYKPADNGTKEPFDLNRVVAMLPFASVAIKDSTLKISGKAVQGALPFSLSLEKNKTPALHAKFDTSTLTTSANTLALGDIALIATPDEKGIWKGDWTISSLSLGDKSTIPALKGGGPLTVEGSLVNMTGKLQSDDKTHNGSFDLSFDAQNMAGAKFVVTTASFPFKEGLITTKNVTIPLSGSDSIRVTLNIQQVSADALMQALTGKRVTATGTLSGTVPVIVSRDGKYTFGKGSLTANGEGLIQMPPDAIPGDNEQVALVRDILENLHYEVLSASIDNQGGGRKITVKLSLSGSNPDVYDGKLVKLNVNLTGDVLDFIQQNVMLFTNPEKLLEQGQ